MGVCVLEVLEVDILWPRWVARIGVTRSTQACFLAADRQCVYVCMGERKTGAVTVTQERHTEPQACLNK